MTRNEAFAEYGAKLNNTMWSVSAFTDEGKLTVSLYANWFRAGEEARTLEYADRLSNWKGNLPGRNEFSNHLKRAHASGASLCIVLAHPDPAQAHLVGQVHDETVIKKTYSVRKDWIGSISFFDGDEYRLVVRSS